MPLHNIKIVLIPRGCGAGASNAWQDLQQKREDVQVEVAPMWKIEKYQIMIDKSTEQLIHSHNISVVECWSGSASILNIRGQES